MKKLKNIKDIQGAIFDMDGTLIDSMEMWDNIASQYLLSKGIMPEDNLGHILKNMSMQQGCDYVIETYSMTETSQEIVAGINTMIVEKYKTELPAKKGALELIEALAKENVAMCVATASDYHLADMCLTRIGIRKYLKGIYTCGEIKTGKDKPELFEYALERLGTQKECTYVFEDSLYAAVTAKQAGFRVVGVYDKISKHESEILKETVDIYITTLDELQ
ncbi:HAD family hydrolase [Lachnotalea glycerini]|uniref:HAD family phosphatase n=1 Tax=Lachnotalea glycerini TaxID=1763509 RepID=A0A255I7J1_9FIRM|nr:HAD family phosphatase [Lachnotalea glycerini]RDY31307.1 HAD family phosphatase [Lachnotalea glycerini]